MDYLNHYLKFIKGKNHRELFQALYSFVGCIRVADRDGIKKMLTDDCVCDISMIGKGIRGKDQICNALIFPLDEVDIRRILISNVVSRQKNGIAYQFAQLQNLYAIELGNDVHPFCFGAQIFIAYQKVDDQWKITKIKYDLAYESGNNSFVAGKWKLIDYAIFSGHEPMINGLYDAPWILIEDDDEEMNEQEQIYDAMSIYNFNVDNGNWGDFKKRLSKDFIMDMSSRGNSNKENQDIADSKMDGARDAIDWVRGKFHKEPRLQHVTLYLGAVFNEDHSQAIAYDYRSELNRLYNNIWDKSLIHAIPMTAIHKDLFVWEDGMWKAKSVEFIPHQEFRYVDDDCIAFDDYICGGKTWKDLNI